MNPSAGAETPLVSIVLLAYNHLEYTKQCVESLYEHTPEGSFELITVDNGSSDGTRAYFDGLPNRKKISFSENIGVDKAVNCGFKYAAGEYLLNLSNDIVLTENWLGNLVACMRSDEKIAMVVPVCGFSSNNQQVRLPYDSLEQMQHIAKEYNRSDPAKWEERLKLVTYVCLFRRAPLLAAGGFDEDFNPGAYDDDAISFALRRAGWKLMLATDTYVHHFGSVTFNEEYAKSDIAARNRALFTRKFGVDAWGAAWIDFNIVGLVNYCRKGPVEILGAGGTCGSTLLQVKNMFRRRGVMDAAIDYLSDSEHNLIDLRTVCRDCIYAPAQDIPQAFPDRLYDLIIVESDTGRLTDAAGFFSGLAGLLKPDGQLISTAADAALPAILGALAGKGMAVTKRVGNYLAFSRSS